MKLSEVSKLSDNVKDKEAILQLIDIKIESDMEKIMNEFKIINSEFKRIEDKIDTKISMLMWAIGILIALIVALKFFVQQKSH